MFDRVPPKDGEYPVIQIRTRSSPESDAEEPRPTQHESMGTKPKVWLTHSDDRDQDSSWLLKKGRPGTGEPWAEKIAYQVGLLLGLPVAVVQLALWDGTGATVSKGFKRPGEALIHGNELLSWVDPAYPRDGGNYRTRQHTVPAVREALRSHHVSVERGFEQVGLDAFGVFVGYLLLDALVCNTDRHHENWAVLASSTSGGRELKLAPSYDHASSLGRELKDERRRLKLDTADLRGNLGAYCEKAASALFEHEGDQKPLTCTQAYRVACGLDPSAAQYWTEVVRRVNPTAVAEIIEKIPGSLMSATAKRFSAGLLTDRLQVLQDSKP